ncbi:MAG: histidine phosphatase family protein [Gemmatimonadota bacterium]
MIERRRLLLMRHGSVDYFDADGRPYPPDDVPLTPHGVAQARAMGEALAAGGATIDRVVTSGLRRTRETARHVLEAAHLAPPVEHWEGFREIRGGRLSEIRDDELRDAFLCAFEGPVPRDTKFLGGETIGQLLDRVLPQVERLRADPAWDTALLVAHGGVNRAVLSWFLTGQHQFLGGLAQDAGCLNVIDIGPTPATSVVRVVNFCAIDSLRTGTRLSTMEELLQKYLKLRGRGGTEDQ